MSLRSKRVGFGLLLAGVLFMFACKSITQLVPTEVGAVPSYTITSTVAASSPTPDSPRQSTPTSELPATTPEAEPLSEEEGYPSPYPGPETDSQASAGDAYPAPGNELQPEASSTPTREPTEELSPTPEPEATEDASPTPEVQPSPTPSATDTEQPVQPTTDPYPGPGTEQPTQPPTSSPTPSVETPTSDATETPGDSTSPGGTVTPTLTNSPGTTSTPAQTPTPSPTYSPTPTLTPTPTAIPLPPWVTSELRATDPDTVQLASGDVQFVEFFAFWCGTCQAMAPTIHGLQEQFEDRMNFVYLDIDDPANDLFKVELGYRTQPHFFLLDANGNIIRQWIGYVDIEEFVEAFEVAL